MLRASTAFWALAVCTALVSGCAPSQRSSAKQLVAQMAYVASDDHIYVTEADGTNRKQVTGQVSGLSSTTGWTYRWPTYSPDGQRLAFAASRPDSSQLGASALLVSDVEQPKPTALLEASNMAAIYLYWSPDSRYVTALLQFGPQLKLYLFDPSGASSARELLVGQPLYWSWAPDGKTIAVHVGGDVESNPTAWVGLLHLGTDDVQTERFPDAPAYFQAPAWSPSGAQLAFATLGGGTTLISVRDAAGHVTNVASGASNVAFSWAPSGDWLAYAYGDPTVPGFYTGLQVVRPDGTDRHALSQDPLAAFYWSPDSAQLAVVGFDSGARALTWTVDSVDGKTKRPLGTFLPSTDFGFALPFFDQFGQSTSVWSSDGKRLVYGARAPNQTEQVMVVGVDGANPGAKVADGDAAVWSPPVTVESR